MIRIHFLNVGQGDCCIIEFLDTRRVAMIDINRTNEMDKETSKEILKSLNEKSYFVYDWIGHDVPKELIAEKGYNIILQDPLEYLKENNIDSIFRFISSHPHMDHLSGIDELKKQFDFTNIWIVKNNYKPDLSKMTESQKKDWNLYKSMRDTLERTIDNTAIIRPEQGDQNLYYNEDGIQILAPNEELKLGSDENANRLSYVLLIRHNSRKILLAGDAEQETWEYLLERHSEELKKIDILKAAHHGRDSGYYQPAVEHMAPKYTIVSVGKKPETDASNKYRQYSENVWSTRWKGNIVFEIDCTGNITSNTQYER